MVLDVIVIGGGPTGIAAAAELKRNGVENVFLIEKGSVTESIRRYPKRMVFFSTAENIEIAGIPFPTSNVKPNRNEALQYYRKVAAYYNLKMVLQTTVTNIQKQEELFEVSTNKGEKYNAKHIVLAIGYFDFPRKLNIPGEELPHVSKYYDEPYGYSFSKVVIVGGGNSAVSAALELYRHDVDVTMVVRGEDFKKTAKYWLIPDLKNRIKEGKIRALFNREVKEIKEKEMTVFNKETGNEESLPADFVLLMIGYLPDVSFFKKIGLEVKGDYLKPSFNENTFETPIENLYLCGTVMAGTKTETIFIENGRDHAKVIAKEISEKLKK